MTAMELSIDPLSPDATGTSFDGALNLRRELDAERDPMLDPDNEALFRAGLAGTERFELRTIVASDGDSVVGIALVHLNHLDSNSDKAEVEIEVHPDHRRHGVGTELAAAVVELAEAEGRTSLTGYSVNSTPVRGFWESLGAERKSMDRQSRLWLADTDESMMLDWVAKRQIRAGDYRLEHFRGATPAHLLPAVAHLNTVMNDAPRDDLDWDDDIWTEDDVVEFNELIIGRGREPWSTVVFGSDDTPAGFTAISCQFEKPRFAHQGNTAVDPAHRNRGLGRWIKADMWLRLREEAPHVEAIDTDNAASNDPMLAINVEMGFKPLLDWSIWQADTSTLRKRIHLRQIQFSYGRRP